MLLPIGTIGRGDKITWSPELAPHNWTMSPREKGCHAVGADFLHSRSFCVSFLLLNLQTGVILYHVLRVFFSTWDVTIIISIYIYIFVMPGELELHFRTIDLWIRPVDMPKQPSTGQDWTVDMPKVTRPRAKSGLGDAKTRFLLRLVLKERESFKFLLKVDRKRMEKGKIGEILFEAVLDGLRTGK